MQVWLTELRNEFEFLNCGLKPVAYLDNAATTQRPKVVVDRMSRFYLYENANIHRGVYKLSQHATDAYEGARQKLATFIGAPHVEEVIFTSGVTQSINTVAHSLGQMFLKEGDEIVVSIAEHHSNLVPWQMAASRYGAKIRFVPLNDDFSLDMKAYKGMLSKNTKIVAIQHVSNVLGVVHPVKEIVSLAKSVGALTVIDGAQAVPHFSVDVQDIGCDFYGFSAHKMFGPVGIGCLWGKSELLKKIPPYQGGGDMIETVTCEGFSCADLPNKFEAGTPNIVGAIGFGATVDFVEKLPKQQCHEHEMEMTSKLYTELQKNPRIKIFSPKPSSSSIGVLTFYHQDVHPHDLAAFADQDGVCIRAGHHCAQPLMKYFGVGSTSRVSPYWYNTWEDIERFLKSVAKAERKLAA